jgi:hypothetical protein
MSAMDGPAFAFGLEDLGASTLSSSSGSGLSTTACIPFWLIKYLLILGIFSLPTNTIRAAFVTGRCRKDYFQHNPVLHYYSKGSNGRSSVGSIGCPTCCWWARLAFCAIVMKAKARLSALAAFPVSAVEAAVAAICNMSSIRVSGFTVYLPLFLDCAYSRSKQLPHRP